MNYANTSGLAHAIVIQSTGTNRVPTNARIVSVRQMYSSNPSLGARHLPSRDQATLGRSLRHALRVMS